MIKTAGRDGSVIAPLNERLRWVGHENLQFSVGAKHEPEFDHNLPVIFAAYDFSKGIRLTPNHHDYLEVAYIHDGSCTFQVGENRFDASAGDVVVLGASQFHSVEATVQQALRIVALYFLPHLIYRPGEGSIDFDYLIPFYSHEIDFNPIIQSEEPICSSIFRRVMRIHRELRLRLPYSPVAVKNLLCDILVDLVRHYVRYSADVVRQAEKSKWLDRLNGSLYFLETHFQEHISLDQIAEIACMSPSHFCRTFKKVTGHPYTEFVKKMRMDKAKNLLQNTEYSIGRIGEEVGFETHSYFDKTFKQLTGISPQEFRTSIRNRK
jgi:AraC family transcriptional regulator, transcriptional activator of pobA